jgi:hypothetical protein
MIRRSLALVALLAAVPTAALAADAVGAAGYVTELQVNQTSSDAYLQYHGRAFIGDKKDGTAEYRWGGTSCGSKVLTDGQVGYLMQAMNTGLRVEPLYQAGQGSAVCLVGFSIIP